MKKFWSIIAMCAMPLMVTSCATNTTEPDDTATPATQEQVKDSCIKVVPGTVIEIREIREEDDCTCRLIREGDDDDDDRYEDGDDRFGHKHHHDNGRHLGHYKKHKHKKHDKYYRTSSEKRTWIVVIVPQCGDSAKYTVICSRDGRVIEIRSDSPSCKKDLRPNDSCITYEQAQTTVTTEKKVADTAIQEWEVEKSPATKEWTYYFAVKVDEEVHLVAVDAKTGAIKEDKVIED
ncbi:MAG: hypothetical protein V4642_01390 [Bacteroidota bacterium]